MSGPIRFYFDFASPYAYVCLGAAERLAAKAGRSLEWRPVLAWAVLKAQGIAAPMEPPAKRGYFLRDMERSASFFGVPYREPVRLPMSSHAAARLWHVLAAEDQGIARDFGQRVFDAFFVRHLDIGEAVVLLELLREAGLSGDEAEAAMQAPEGRTRLEACVADAVDDGCIGSPYFVVDGEGFFGADRLPQLRWRLGVRTEDAAHGAREAL